MIHETDTPLDVCPHCGATDDCMCFSEELKRLLKASKAEVERLNRLLCDLLILTEKQYWNSNNYKQIKKAYHENK